MDQALTDISISQAACDLTGHLWTYDHEDCPGRLCQRCKLEQLRSLKGEWITPGEKK